eukprot:s3612_g9.t1
MLASLEELSREKICNIVQELFSCCHAEAMIMGNQTPEDAQKLVRELEEKSAWTSMTLMDSQETLKIPGQLNELKMFEEAVLPSGRTLWNLESTDKDQRSLPLVTFIPGHNPPLPHQDDPNHCVVAKTQQQLGYIVGMGIGTAANFNFLTAQVQSEFPPDYVRSRIDAFYNEYFAWIEDSLEEEEFQTCLKGVLSELKMKPKNLSEEFQRYQSEFLMRTYDYDRRAKKIDFVQRRLDFGNGLQDQKIGGSVQRPRYCDEMTLAKLKGFVSEIREAPLFYVQVKKVLDKEDKPLPENVSVPEEPGLSEERSSRDVAAHEHRDRAAKCRKLMTGTL